MKQRTISLFLTLLFFSSVLMSCWNREKSNSEVAQETFWIIYLTEIYPHVEKGACPPREQVPVLPAGNYQHTFTEEREEFWFTIEATVGEQLTSS